MLMNATEFVFSSKPACANQKKKKKKSHISKIKQDPKDPNKAMKRPQPLNPPPTFQNMLSEVSEVNSLRSHGL